MESIGSNSTPSDHHQNYRPRYRVSQPVTDRIGRALRHQLRLLHRSDSLFFILGATGNVYTVNLSFSPSCTCPDRMTPCKHILFVFIRVLGVSPDDTCLRRKTLRPCKLHRLLSTPTLPESVARVNLRGRFHELYFKSRNEKGSNQEGIAEVVKDGSNCPICLEEMSKEDRVVGCGTCRNLIHEECWLLWKRSKGRRSACCVICRSKWRDRHDQDHNYLNLAAFFSEEDNENWAESSGGFCGG